MSVTIEQAPNGAITGVNRFRLNEFPFFLLTQPSANSVAMAANSASVPTIVSNSGRAPSMIQSFGHSKTGSCMALIQIQDGKNSTSIMNSACDADTIFGSVGKPYILPEQLYLDETRNLVMRFTDTSNAPNAIRFNANAARFGNPQLDMNLDRAKARMDSKQYITMPYFYTMIPTNTPGAPIGALRLAAGGVSQQLISLDTNYNFQLVQISCKSTGLFSINISDAATGESLIDTPSESSYQIRSDLLCGNGQFPFKFHHERIFYRSTKLVIDITDLSGAQNDIYVTLGGRHVIERMWKQ